MAIKRFEDLECWQVARSLTNTIYKHSRLPRFARDFKLVDQIRGASISIMNNISEGFDAKSNQEFIRFLSYSRRSCSEVQNCLYVALDQGYIAAADFEDCYAQCARIRQIIDGLIRYLRSNKNRRVNGQLLTDTDQRTRNGQTGNGQRATDNGKRATGKRATANGQRQTGNGQRANGQRANGQT